MTERVAELQNGGDPNGNLPWETKVTEHQEECFEIFGYFSFDSFKKRLPSICKLLLKDYCVCLESETDCENDSELQYLRVKIGYALYGQPPKLEGGENNNSTGYNVNQNAMIDKVYNIILQKQTKMDCVLMAPIYVFIEGRNETGDVTALSIPIFRIPCRYQEKQQEDSSEPRFVDNSGRYYHNWEDFITSNKLPASKICYPKDGIYAKDSSGNLQLCFGYTPAATLEAKILQGADIFAAVTGFGTCALGVAAASFGALLAPVTVPCAIVGGAVGLYCLGRSSAQLADRGRHGESLADRESIRHWISVGGCVLGFASSGSMAAIRYMAQEGQVVSNVATGIVTGVNISSLAMNGVGLAENLWTLIEEGSWRDPAQLLQFSASVLFFAHAVVNIKTAGSLYRETQNQILEDHRAGLRSNRLRKVYDGIYKQTLKNEPDPIAGRATAIRGLRHIPNKNEFFANSLRSNKAARKTSQPVHKLNFRDICATNGEKISNGIGLGRNFFEPLSNNISPNPTVAGNLNSGFLNSTPSDNFQVLQEPELLSVLRKIIYDAIAKSTVVNQLRNLIEQECRKFRYGKYLMQAFDISIDFCNAYSTHDIIEIILKVIQISKEFLEELWLGANEQSDSSNSHERSQEIPKNFKSEEKIYDVVSDVGFVPHLLCMLKPEDKSEVEEVYHFPNHLEWGENGELSPEDYIFIGQNTFGICNVECANICHESGNASVYFVGIGLVTITSYVKERKIVVKKYHAQECNKIC